MLSLQLSTQTNNKVCSTVCLGISVGWLLSGLNVREPNNIYFNWKLLLNAVVLLHETSGVNHLWIYN